MFDLTNLSIGQLSIISCGILAYVVLGRKIYLERGVGQNILSYTLWVILDVVQYLVTKSVDGESTLLLLVFMVGGASIVLLLYKLNVRGKLKKNDYYVIGGVIVCVFTWQVVKAPILAIVFASLAQFVAGIPLLRETWINPRSKYLLPNFIFLYDTVLGIVFIENYKLEDTLFQYVMILYLVIVIGMIMFRSNKTSKDSWAL